MRLGLGLATMALSAVALLAAAAVGTSTATFTATATNPTNSFATATLTMSSDKPNAGDLVRVTHLVPGDTAARTVIIANTGNVGFTYTAAISATANTLLWSDTTNGLQVTVKRGTNVLYTGPLKNLALAASGTIAAGATDTLTYDFSFPTTADNTFQNLTQDFTVTYTATQLAGGTR